MKKLLQRSPQYYDFRGGKDDRQVVLNRCYSPGISNQMSSYEASYQISSVSG